MWAAYVTQSYYFHICCLTFWGFMQQFLRESNHFLPKSNLFLLHSLLFHPSVTFLLKTLHYFGVLYSIMKFFVGFLSPFNPQHYPLLCYIQCTGCYCLGVTLYFCQIQKQITRIVVYFSVFLLYFIHCSRSFWEHKQSSLLMFHDMHFMKQRVVKPNILWSVLPPPSSW